MLLATVNVLPRLSFVGRNIRRFVPLMPLVLGWALQWSVLREASALDPRTNLNANARQRWTAESGLPQDSVHAIAQTADGYLWIGTEEGLARFDGYQFRFFDHANTPALKDDDVRCLLADGSGALWVGTGSGLTRIRGGDARDSVTVEGVPAGGVRELLRASDGRLWVLTDGGVGVTRSAADMSGQVRLRSLSVPFGLLDASALSIAEDGGSGVWIGTSAGLYHAVGERVERGPTELASTRINALATGESAGKLLIGTPDRALELRAGVLRTLADRADVPVGGVRWLVTTGEGTWAVGRNGAILVRSTGALKLTTGRELPGSQITAVFRDRAGAVWFGTNAGVAREWQGRVERQGGNEGPVPAVLSLAEDRDGDVWIGTETAGIEELRFRIFAPLAGSPDSVDHPATSVLQTRSGVEWVGTNGAGLTQITSRGIRTFTTKDGLTSDTILALAADGQASDDLWVGTPDGLNLFHGGRWRVLTSSDGLVDDLVRSLLVSRDGAVWIGSRHGATRWKDGRGKTLTKAQGLGSDVVGPMLEEANGDLWMGTSAGLARVRSGAVRNFTTSDGLPGNIIAALESARAGGFWIAVEGKGLARWMGSGFISFSNVAAIPREINSIVDDSRGSLWLSSAQGVMRVAIADLDRHAADPKSDVSVVLYGAGDGITALPSGGVGYPAAWKFSDDHIAFATRHGVMVADASVDPVHGGSPAVVIEEVSLDGRSVAGEELGQLGPGVAHLTFSFAGINLAAPQRVQYRYMLRGLDKGWLDAGARRTAYYTNLPHGQYVFSVEARNAGGAWSAPVDLPLEVRAHVYEMAWFRALLALCVIVIGFAIYRLRVRALQGRFAAVSAERSRLAREIHDTLAQSFVAVSVRLELLSQMLRGAQGVDACRAQLDETRTLVRESLAEARRSIWDLRSEGAAQSLPARLGTVVQQAKGSVPDADLVTSGTYRPLPRETEDELLRIAQEAVSNVVRHAKAASLRVRLQYEMECVWMEIVDDGRGFDPLTAASRRDGHFGLTGVRERARILRGDVMLESEPGRGTRMRVTVPVTADAVRDGGD